MKRFLIFFSTLLLLSTLACGGPDASKGGSDVAVSSHSGGALKWSSDWDGALKKAQTEDKVVLVDFYADWCVWCKKLEKDTLSDGAVAAYLGERVVPLRLNVDTNGRARSREFRVDGLPTLVVLSAEGREIGRIPGYLPPDAFLERIQGFLGS